MKLLAIALVLAFGCGKKKAPQAPANAAQKPPTDDKPKKPAPDGADKDDADESTPEVKEDPCAGGQ